MLISLLRLKKENTDFEVLLAYLLRGINLVYIDVIHTCNLGYGNVLVLNAYKPYAQAKNMQSKHPFIFKKISTLKYAFPDAR